MIAHFNIDRTARVLIINIETAMVAAVFGQRAKNIPVLEVLVQKAIADRRQRVIINVIAIKNSNLNATLVAKRIAMRLENRESFRIVQKKVMSDALKAGALGVKTSVAGRLGGVDMARREGYKKGLIPLGTLRAVIDYAMVEANTTYGKIGVKV